MGSAEGMWGGRSWLMVLAVVVTAACWVAVVVATTRVLRPTRRGPPEAPEPLRGLDEQLARGEIGVEEYRSRRRRLVDGH